MITERAVAKHTAWIFLRLGLQPSEDDNRRVLAVLVYLGTSQNTRGGYSEDTQTRLEITAAVGVRSGRSRDH